MFFTDVENPRLTGRAPLRLNAMTITREPLAPGDPARVISYEVETYTPDGVQVRSVVAPGERSGFTDGVNVAYAFLDVAARAEDAPAVIDQVGNWPFTLPSISLPADGTPREFVLTTVRGRTATEPTPGSIAPPIGFDEQEVDRIRLALADGILVLPMRVFVFADQGGQTEVFGGDGTAERLFFEQVVDPGAMVQGKLAQQDSDISSRVSVEAFAVRDDIDVFAPDGPWRACGIQFHLESVEVIAQSDGLERIMLGHANPCSAAATDLPFYTYLPGFPTRDRELAVHAVPVFVSARLGVDLLGATAGASCGPFAYCSHVPRDWSFVALSRDALFAGPEYAGHALAHELGHYLGLGHPGSGSDDCQASVPGTSNLMFSGGPPDHSAASGELTADQCQRARCLAAGWLARWTLPGSEERMAAEERQAAECVGVR